ncbi:MAG: tryptophan synthase subunit alpha [SAR202 cluster bacterium]|nr:tryptophan synthase subunit alpha [SAR202 cluster bacterium]
MSTGPIQQAFEDARRRRRTAIAPFLTIGYPTVDASLDAVKAVATAGADLVELGIPFSDPLAEGPTIQMSSHHALGQGVTPAICIASAARLRADGLKIPLVFMGYYNPLMSYGLGRFCDAAAESGVNGLIVADLPTEEAGPLRSAAEKRGLDLIPLLALTSPEPRIAAACRDGRGFVYCVSLLGVTGARAMFSARVRGLVEVVRRHTSLPVAVGFGISTAAHVKETGEFADGVVVGSALIDAMRDGPVESAPERAEAYIRGLALGAARPTGHRGQGS